MARAPKVLHNGERGEGRELDLFYTRFQVVVIAALGIAYCDGGVDVE